MTYSAMTIVVALSLFSSATAFAAMGDPIPIGIGEILAQYDSAPTDPQKRACEKNGGEITQLRNGKAVCVRRRI